MSRTDNEIRITPSVLDRLIDENPEISREPPASRSTSFRILKQAVKRDLEWLLNTRVAEAVPEDLPELSRSVAGFGLPDFSNNNLKSMQGKGGLRHAIERAISTFEPRLEGVVVTLERANETDRSVRFRIDARLRVEPTPEPVAFDTLLELGSGEFVVKGD